MKTPAQETQNLITPEKALQLLKEGNIRFLENRSTDRDLKEQILKTSTAQNPFAVILGCIDSRVPQEVIFDLGIGDIFSIRIAGNLVNTDILGSMEFACKVIGSKHILVLGHTNCGAIQGARDNVTLGHLTGLLDKLKPAVESVKKSSTQKDQLDINLIAEANVHLMIKQISMQSPILKEMLDSGAIGISGAMYDVTSGGVTFL